MNNNLSPRTLTSFNYDVWRETFITTILRISCVLGIVVFAGSFQSVAVTDRVLFIALYVILLLVTVLRTGYSIRASTLLLILYAVGVNSILAWGPWLDGNVFFIAFIILSALLFDRRVDIAALAASILTFALIAVMQEWGGYQLRSADVPSTAPADWIAYTLNFTVTSAIILAAIGQLKREFANIAAGMQNTFQTLANERAGLEKRVGESTGELEAQANQLRSSAIISRSIAEIQDISKLMEMTTRLTAEQFGHDHVGLYLLDERKRRAFLQSASSENGKKLIGRGFLVEPDRLNLIHRVIENSRPYIASDDDSANFIRDPNFPLTRSRMALPLTVRSNMIGVLDIHSNRPQAFGIRDAEALQTLADLIAISIDNARLINETKNLVRQLEANNIVQTRETWSKFTSRQKPAYQYTPAGVRPIFATRKQDDTDGIRVPLILHGQQIGNITLKRTGANAGWSERERLLVEKVADQTALAIENSRLVDETQKSALRDQAVANISARIRETLDVESVLRTAATELRKVFDLKEAEISIGALQAESPPLKKKTGSLR